MQAAHWAGRRLALLFDYDGTLTPIAAHPALALLSEPMRRVLRYLAYREGVSVGILSGRRLDDVRAMVGLPGLFYAGTSGLELDLGGGRMIAPGAAEGRPLIEAAVGCWHEVAAGYAGAWVEAKEFGLTLHYREVDARQAEELCTRARQALHAHVGWLRVLAGPRALEATLPVGWNKGTAVELMADRAGSSVAVLYAGDGENDREAFETVRAMKGGTLGIGSAAPEIAEHRLASPEELEELLVRLLRALH
jgi:trehalose-phosphatase